MTTTTNNKIARAGAISSSGATTIVASSWTTNVTGVASAGQSTSPIVDDSVNNYFYPKITLTFTSASAATSATGFAEVWLLDSPDNTVYPTPYTNGILLGSLAATANSTAYAGTFLGPEGCTYIKIVVNNQTGAQWTAGQVILDWIYSQSIT